MHGCRSLSYTAIIGSRISKPLSERPAICPSQRSPHMLYCYTRDLLQYGLTSTCLTQRMECTSNVYMKAIHESS